MYRVKSILSLLLLQHLVTNQVQHIKSNLRHLQHCAGRCKTLGRYEHLGFLPFKPYWQIYVGNHFRLKDSGLRSIKLEMGGIKLYILTSQETPLLSTASEN